MNRFQIPEILLAVQQKWMDGLLIILYGCWYFWWIVFEPWLLFNHLIIPLTQYLIISKSKSGHFAFAFPIIEAANNQCRQAQIQLQQQLEFLPSYLIPCIFPPVHERV